MRQLRKARDAYRRAIRLAAEEECPHLQMMATQGFAQACHALKRFDLIETAFREMLGTADAVGHIQSKISAYYGIGISQKCRGLDQEAQCQPETSIAAGPKAWPAYVGFQVPGRPCQPDGN